MIKLSLQEYLVPQEYVDILRESMLNKCPVSSYEQVCEVVKNELGELPDKVHHISLFYLNVMAINIYLLLKLAAFCI